MFRDHNLWVRLYYEGNKPTFSTVWCSWLLLSNTSSPMRKTNVRRRSPWNFEYMHFWGIFYTYKAATEGRTCSSASLLVNTNNRWHLLPAPSEATETWRQMVKGSWAYTTHFMRQCKNIPSLSPPLHCRELNRRLSDALVGSGGQGVASGGKGCLGLLQVMIPHQRNSQLIWQQTCTKPALCHGLFSRASIRILEMQWNFFLLLIGLLWNVLYIYIYIFHF